MFRTPKLFACLLLAVMALSLAAPAYGYGTGVKVYVPTQRSAAVSGPNFSYGGSFVVYNDGYRDGVYIVRVTVTDPASINWLNMSATAFTLRPGQSKLIDFTLNATGGNIRPGDYDFIFAPTLLTTGVEPYMDQFATYNSSSDWFRFRLNVSGVPPAASTKTPIVFAQANRTNLAQYSQPRDTNMIVAQLDRAIKLDLPDRAIVGQPVPVSISIFQGLSDRGISLMAVSPDGSAYPMGRGNYTFNSIGLWGVMVLVEDEIILGKTVDVTPAQSPLAGLDAGTVLAGLALLALLSLVPLWLMAPAKEAADPYQDIIYKAYVIRKYIDKFDRDRLRRAVQVLKEEHEGLVSKGARGSRDEASRSIDELSTLSLLE